MSTAMIVILAGAAGGAMWAGVTLAATWWFNRRVRRLAHNRAPLNSAKVDALRAKILGRP